MVNTHVMLASPPGIDTSVMATKPVSNLLSDVTVPLRSVAVAAANPPTPVSVAPKRKLARVNHTWECDEHFSNTQLSIEESTFVYVWADSKTAAGWVYAESLICSSRAGWLPASMLQQLPSNKCWMRVSKPCNAMFPTQMTVDIGNIVLVDVLQTPAGDGWVYAEQLGSAMGRCEHRSPCVAGWVPIQCLIWAEV